MRADRCVVRQVEELFHDRIEVCVQLKNRLYATVPRNRVGRGEAAPQQNADKVPLIDRPDLCACKRWSNAVHLTIDKTAWIARIHCAEGKRGAPVRASRRRRVEGEGGCRCCDRRNVVRVNAVAGLQLIGIGHECDCGIG